MRLQTCLKRYQGISRIGFANGGACLAPAIFHPLPAAGNWNINTARLDLPVAAEPVIAASRSSSATPGAVKTPAVKPTTTYWPCKDGQLVRVVQTSGANETHTLEITVERLQENQEARLLWGVYRSSPHAWQHPDSINIPGSQIDEASGAMMSPMTQTSSTTQSIKIEVPAGLSPVTFAFLISLTPDTTSQQKTPSSGKKLKRRFAVPLEGRHFSALLGAQPGVPTPLGPSTPPFSAAASKKGGSKKTKIGDTTAVNFAVRSRGGTSVALVLVQPPATKDENSEWTCVELALDPILNRTGDTWHITLPSLRNVEKLCYGWRVDGDVSWESGYRISPEVVLVDPEAPALVHLPQNCAPPPLPLPTVELSDGSRVLVASAVSCKFDKSSSEKEGRSAPLYRPLEKMRVLEIDVKKFAQGGKVKHPGTFVGVTERLDHIRAVGANTVILAPCHATAKGAGSHSHHAALSFIAPDPALSTDPTNPGAAHAEFREMVHALHAAGVEVIPSLDLTFTADGVDSHPTGVSLRGLDNAAYFRPNGVVNCGHPAFQSLIHRATRYWALQFGVDGFCFLNAENMAQDAEGLVMDAPSLPEALCQDPILSGLKLIAAPSHETSLLPRGDARGFPHWGIWQQRNSAFTRDVTALLAEVSHTALDGVAARLTGSSDMFGAGWSFGDEFSPLPGNLAAERRPSFSFNAAAMQNGPSVTHLASEAAGAAGAAVMASGGGPMPTATTIAKAMLLATLLAQGVPVINHEDVADLEMARFVGVVSRLRRKLAHLLLPPKFDSPRDLTWHGATATNEPEWVGAAAVSGGEGGEGGEYGPYHAPHGSSYLGFSVRHPDGSAVYVGFNPHPMTVTATLPAAPAGHTWLRAVDTSLEAPQDAAMENLEEVEGEGYLVSGKAAIVLVAAVIEHLK